MEQTLKRTTTTKAELIELGKQAIEELAKLEAITDIEFMMNRKHHSSSVAVVIFLYNEKRDNVERMSLYEFIGIDENKSNLERAIEAIRSNSLEEFRKIQGE